MRRRTGQDGATAAEYAIMLALVATVIIAIVVIVGRQTCEEFETYTREVDATAAPTISTTGGTCTT